jgi:glycosyltransferase involved in cell wall biosynthesis
MGKKYTIFINHPSDYMTDCEPHGDGLIAYQFIDRLARRGHQLYVAAPIVKLREPLHANVHLFVLKTHYLPSSRFSSWPHKVEYALRVRHLFQRLRADIHFDIIHQLNPITTGVNLFLPSGGIPFIGGPVPPSWPKPEQSSRLSSAEVCRSLLKRLVQWELFRRTNCILVPVSESRDALPDSISIRSRVRLLHYGIDTTRFAPMRNSVITPELDPHILFLANLHKRKGIYDLLEAFEAVVRAVPQARLTIAGDGPEKERVEQLVDAMPAPNRVTILGAIPRDKVADVFRSCSVYCLPSHGEPFGMAALEAMSCGKPVVATAAGGLDYLVDGEGGVKVPVGDSEKLAEALIRLLKDPQLCRQMGEHNREVAVSAYDWDLVVSNLERIYEQTIQGH